MSKHFSLWEHIILLINDIDVARAVMDTYGQILNHTTGQDNNNNK